ncbi:hypothetical protein [Desulfitobacterium sp. AusDCA]|uniref:hypothetical protein n=1 Tax=Desulfitobacterium sp. AusDCA TaxID=3240383 RepID=UPI003DA740FC
MKSKKRKFSFLIGITIAILLFIYLYFNHNLTNVYSNDYLKIIDNIFSNDSKGIKGAVVLWAEGDDPLMDQLYSNYPLDTSSFTYASSHDNQSDKYYLIMDLIREVPNLEKVNLNDLNNRDYHILGANLTWEVKRNFMVYQRAFYVRLFVDKNNNIYLPEIYPYHDNNAKSIVGNRFIVFKANDKVREIIEKIF